MGLGFKVHVGHSAELRFQILCSTWESKEAKGMLQASLYCMHLNPQSM